MEIKNYEVPLRQAVLPSCLLIEPNVRVFAGENKGSPYYPSVIITQIDTPTLNSTRDTAGYHHVRYSFDVNVFTNGDNARENNSKLSNAVSSVLQSLGFSLNSQNQNLGDMLKRYERTVMRFSAIIDTETDTTFKE